MVYGTLWCWLWFSVLGPNAYSSEQAGGRAGSLGLGSRETLIGSPSSGLTFATFLWISNALFFPLQILMFLKAQLILQLSCTLNEVYFLLVPVKQL